MQATGIILAGGKSSRMGTNKAFLEVGNQAVIERIIAELSKIVSDLVVVTNHFAEYQSLGVPMTEDNWKGKGPLAGMEAGLLASKHDKNLVVACDMPFISVKLGQFLLEQLNQYEAAVPEINSRLHPLFAAYRKETVPSIQESLSEDQLKIRSFLHRVNSKILKEDELSGLGLDGASLYNMNNPDEYRQALQLAKQFKQDGQKGSDQR
ncbi:molybdenum cofactor guanylyltransferase [Bacillus canaveralius]|uniref:Probable molybdenum cofactor guanylyltransferase n=1 Tax=Bacillus canaveralius TaxID=1403243 RepID=A0A2N5GJU9_9BACI|nr:molybdenum cofactor guanylyltransferase [Bacillus canaveralius]PLR81587.1 molybdenum cofactor guanylyltransferase [Bacillus canaveralius]PLR90873.1 molybdenum cofactor guanylyltransferase [Bacillus canaveralius]